MKLYLMRHAEALDGADDAKRPLSPHGKKEAREVGRFLKTAGVAFGAAYSSPLVRARQTAEIVMEICGEAALELDQALLNETAQPDFDRWLAGLLKVKRVLLVGHSPSLDERFRRLLGTPSLDSIKMAKGALACLDTDDGRRATLKFFVTPKLLGVRDD